jgi:hypothetical protein
MTIPFEPEKFKQALQARRAADEAFQNNFRSALLKTFGQAQPGKEQSRKGNNTMGNELPDPQELIRAGLLALQAVDASVIREGIRLAGAAGVHFGDTDSDIDHMIDVAVASAQRGASADQIAARLQREQAAQQYSDAEMAKIRKATGREDINDPSTLLKIGLEQERIRRGK